MQAIAKDAARPRSFWLASQQFACLSKRLASVLAWVAGSGKAGRNGGFDGGRATETEGDRAKHSAQKQQARATKYATARAAIRQWSSGVDSSSPYALSRL
jgi:hypothetical protein